MLRLLGDSDARLRVLQRLLRTRVHWKSSA